MSHIRVRLLDDAGKMSIPALLSLRFHCHDAESDHLIIMGQANSQSIFDQFFTADGQSKAPPKPACTNDVSGKKNAASVASAKKCDSFYTNTHIGTFIAHTS